MPPPGIAGVGDSFLGSSATIASVVMRRPAIEDAPCNAWRTTLVGSMMPFFKVSEFAALSVEAVAVRVVFNNLADDDGTVLTGIDGNLACRNRKRLAHDVDAVLLVLIGDLHPLERFGGAQESDTTAGKDAFLDCSTGRMHCVVDAILTLLHFDLCSAA